MLTLSVPEGWPSSLSMPATASCRVASAPPICARKRSPPSVSVSRRVLRWNSRTPSRASSRATFLLTAAGVSPRRRAAAEKLPPSALCTKEARWLSGSIVLFSTKG